ncbi:MAG: pyridoxamine 5'-phosphate oxidase family protein [Methanosarcinales archaeon]|nr:pyridoxamine 5'-phosphate oxidase family protein [Methanosarcinales archaeon]
MISDLLGSQPLAVLATEKGGQPYASLVAFAATPDLHSLIFATSRSTRKFANMQSSPHGALLVDNRTNHISDFRDGLAVTAAGKVGEVEDDKKEEMAAIYLRKHPHLAWFLQSPNLALMSLQVSSYTLVSKFQCVVEMDVHD